MKKLHFKKKSIIIISIAFLVLVSAITILLSYLNKTKYSKYDEYSTKIERYGFSHFYNNGQATSDEYVSKLELAKLVIGVSQGKYDLSGTIVQSDNEEENLITYANTLQIATNKELNLDTANNRATYEDMFSYMANAKQIILNKSLDDYSNINIQDFSNLSGKIQAYIKDLIANNIIDNTEYKINLDKNIRKGELNQILVRYIEKYSTITYNNAQILLDEEKMPSNKEEYPYIVENVNKEVYEQPYIVDYESNFANPLRTFDLEKSDYNEMISICEKYYNNILNINYNTIAKEEFKNNIKDLLVFSPDDEIIDKYINYVKQNKIILNSIATAQTPIVYSDGSNLRIRMKLDITISSSDTKDNLLYLDDFYGKKVTYNENTFTIYIDAVMGYVYGSNKIYNKECPIYENLIEMSKNKIIVSER